MNSDILRFVRYLSFRMDCLREQEENPMKLDIQKAEENLQELERLRDEKVEELVEVMPKVPVLATKTPPKNPLKADGSYSVHGLNWRVFLKEQGLPLDTNEEVTYIKDWKPSKPTYHADVKAWLESLGWKPCTFKFQRNKITGEVKQIPQIKYQKGHDREGELCDSVMNLFDKEPSIEKLEGLSVIQHRIGLLSGKQDNSGFLKAQREGYITASAGGFTNTMRFKHRAPVANLPQPSSAYGEMIRCVLTCDEGKVMCGADVVSLEDTLKQHFIYPYDPEYVEEMQVEGYDPHIALALFAGKVSQEDVDLYNNKKAPWVKGIRKNYKTVNYAAQYGVQKATLARQSNLKEREAQELLDMYWAKNWAIKKAAKDQYVKTLKDGTMWLKNPVNGFYYSLRNERDIFSTLVQGTGDYVFNMWTLFCRQMGLVLSLNYHDEWLSITDVGNEDHLKEVANKAMEKLNERLNLNVKVCCDFQTGKNYAECH